MLFYNMLGRKQILFLVSCACFFTTTYTIAQGHVLTQPILSTCLDPLISEEQQVACSEKEIQKLISELFPLSDSLQATQFHGVYLFQLRIKPNGEARLLMTEDSLSPFFVSCIDQFNRQIPNFICPQEMNKEKSVSIPVKWLMRPIKEIKNSYRIEWGPKHNSSISRTDLDDSPNWICKIRGKDGVEIEPHIVKIQAYKGRHLAAEFIEAPTGVSEKCAAFIRKRKINKIILECTFREIGQMSERQIKRTCMLTND